MISAFSCRRDLKQSHSMRTNRRPIAIMRRSCSDSPVTASQLDAVFGSDRYQMAEHIRKRQGLMAREPQPESRGRVSLPMYNLPEMRAVNAAFWDAIRRELQRQGIKSLPTSLDFDRQPVPERIERDALLTQVCGYPLQ